jgi:hypothetical protein
MNSSKFYDVHFHVMDLSHANLTAIIDRYINNELEVKKILKKSIPRWKIILGSFVMPMLGLIVPYTFLAKRLTKLFRDQKKVRNLLSFMETTVLYDFLIVEYFLKNNHKDQKAIVSKENEFYVAGEKYNKIVLCPLIIDFGYPNIKNNDYFYNIPPQKPVTKQIRDLYKAIRAYYTKELIISESQDAIRKFEIKDKVFNKENELFEIYPFMGINTANYTLAEIQKMLEKYFSDFSKEDTKEIRYKKLYTAMGEFHGDLDNKEMCKNIFAGIKLYPPLGFNPWPDEKDEKEKVEYLYQMCIEKNIPIITHCSTRGFVASPLHKELTNPNNKWEDVLNDQRFSNLKINFAHMGESDAEWTNKILTLATDSNHNIFADFSSVADSPEYYNKLKTQLAPFHNVGVDNKILYGSDFMINLLKVNSLNEYMGFFIVTDKLTDEQKNKFINANPENFLFGGN